MKDIKNWVSSLNLSTLEIEKFCSTKDLKPPDPVHSHLDGTWWWYDETWGDEYGPFSSREEAMESCKQYCKEVLG